MKPKRPTQEDVANKANVSRGTVSMVLNQTRGRFPISSETQKRVLDAARALGYSPNPVAQMLARGNTQIIGIYPFEGTIPFTPSDFYYTYLLGIEQEAASLGYNILLFTRNRTNVSLEIYQDGIDSLRLADGLILTGNYPNEKVLQWLLQEKYPFVLIGRSHLPKDKIDTIVNDHQPYSYEATQHLITLNHRKLGFIVDDLTLAYHQERLSGSELAVGETPGASLIIMGSEVLNNASTFKNTLSKNGITALICADRKLVSRTVEVMQQASLHVPDDMSVVFLVSNPWELPFANPTRVNLNRDEKGKVAVRRLIKRLEGNLDGYQQIQVPCKFVVGDTTAPRVL